MIGTGTAVWIESDEEKELALRILMRSLTKNDDIPFDRSSMSYVDVRTFKVVADAFTAKRRMK